MTTPISPMTAQSRLDALWEEFVAQKPNPEQILDLFRLVKGLRQKAWELYCAIPPTEDDICRLFKLVEFSHLLEYPGRWLVKNSTSADSLVLVIKKDDKLRYEAVDELLMRLSAGPVENIFRWIITNHQIDVSQRERAAEMLITRAPTPANLGVIMIHCPATALSAGRRLLKCRPCDNTLSQIIIHLPILTEEIWMNHRQNVGKQALSAIIHVKPPIPHRHEAGKALLEMSEDFSGLSDVFKLVPELREEAWRKLQNIELSPAWGEALIREAPEFEQRVTPLIKHPPRDADAIKDEMMEVEREARIDSGP